MTTNRVHTTGKRYLLFHGWDYYPSGGWNDFGGSFDTIDDAKAAVPHGDWWHVVDTESWEEVAGG